MRKVLLGEFVYLECAPVVFWDQSMKLNLSEYKKRGRGCDFCRPCPAVGWPAVAAPAEPTAHLVLCLSLESDVLN